MLGDSLPFWPNLPNLLYGIADTHKRDEGADEACAHEISINLCCFLAGCGLYSHRGESG